MAYNAILTAVSSSTTSVPLLGPNDARKGFTIYNDGSANLYVALGGKVTLTLFTAKIPPSTYYEMPISFDWQGGITGIWDSVSGSARITDVS